MRAYLNITCFQLRHPENGFRYRVVVIYRTGPILKSLSLNIASYIGEVDILLSILSSCLIFEFAALMTYNWWVFCVLTHYIILYYLYKYEKVWMLNLLVDRFKLIFKIFKSIYFLIYSCIHFRFPTLLQHTLYDKIIASVEFTLHDMDVLIYC